MSDIVLSAGVRSNLLQLQQTSDLITQTQNRLATGKRVNSALDNPINYFTAQNLSGRANDLNSLLDSMSTAPAQMLVAPLMASALLLRSVTPATVNTTSAQPGMP